MLKNSHPPLKLIIEEEEELLHAAALLQDGIVSVTSMHYDKARNTFSCLINRFCWEDVHHGMTLPYFERIHSGLTIFGVQKVIKKNFHQSHPQRNLNLLTFTLNETFLTKHIFEEDHLHHQQARSQNLLRFRFIFSGGFEVDVFTTKLEVHVKDFGHRWPTMTIPEHYFAHGISA